MKMREILFDAIKYPFYGWKQIIILGLITLISSKILGQYNDLITYLDITLPDIVLFLISIITNILILILIFLEAGYAYKIIEKSVHGIEKPPQFNKLVSMFKHGTHETLIGLIYSLIPIIFLIIIINDIFTKISMGLSTILSETLLLLIILAVVLGFAASIIFTVAIPHMAYKNNEFKDAFSFKEIFRKIRQIGITRLLIAYLGIIIGIVVIGAPILKEVIESANIFGFVVSELIIAPYLLMFYARFIALIYRN